MGPVERVKVERVAADPVAEFVAEGRLHRIGDRPACPITLASVLALAGWPVAPAPLAAPLAVVPA